MHFNLQPPAVTVDQYLKYCNLCQNNKRHILYVPDKFQLQMSIFLTICVIFGCGNNIQKYLKDLIIIKLQQKQ